MKLKQLPREARAHWLRTCEIDLAEAVRIGNASRIIEQAEKVAYARIGLKLDDAPGELLPPVVSIHYPDSLT